MRSRGIAIALSVAVMLGGTGGVLAVSGGDDGGNAAGSQYKPGKGCGDKNHQHARHDECKNHGNGGGGDEGNGNGGDEGNGNGHGHGHGHGHGD